MKWFIDFKDTVYEALPHREDVEEIFITIVKDAIHYSDEHELGDLTTTEAIRRMTFGEQPQGDDFWYRVLNQVVES
jgi:hypothetical protein